MAIEIEKKFLVINQDWRNEVQVSHHIIQGYLSTDPHRAIRIRISDQNADINIKYSEDGIDRLEYEYPIPLADAKEMMQRLIHTHLIEKIRHIVPYQGFEWEIDEFLGDNAGLIVAEIELQDRHQSFTKPPWLGDEISTDPRYFNSTLCLNPYSRW